MRAPPEPISAALPPRTAGMRREEPLRAPAAPGAEPVLLSEELVREGLRLVGALGPGRVEEEVLASLARATDARGAALWIAEGGRALHLAASAGLTGRAGLASTLDMGDAALARALLAGTPDDAPGAAPGESLRVPLLAGGEPVGLALLERRARGRFGPAERGAAGALAPFAAAALWNARRFAAVERLALREGDSGAYQLPYFVDCAGRKLSEARRYGRALSLATVAVEGAAASRRAAGRDLFRAAMRALVAAVGRVGRDADVLAKAAEGEYHALLPETDGLGALVFARRATEEIRRDPAVRALAERAPLELAVGVASYPEDSGGFEGLLAVCRARAEERRTSLARRLGLDAGRPGFWEAADLLLGGGAPADGGRSALLPRGDELFRAAQREAARDIGRDPRARALLYLGVPREDDAAEAIGALPGAPFASRAGDGRPRVHLLGPRGAGAAALAHPLLTRLFVEGDARFDGHAFLLFRAARAAYALLLGPGALFHTCDAPLVDALVARLQAQYDLQPL
jgi:two-component system cell cycle response regulator